MWPMHLSGRSSESKGSGRWWKTLDRLSLRVMAPSDGRLPPEPVLFLFVCKRRYLITDPRHGAGILSRC